MKHTQYVLAMSLILGIGIAHAAPSYEPVLQSFDALSKAKEKDFKGLKEADLKKIREEFSSRSQATLSASKSEYAVLSRGKSDAQMDKLLWARAEKADVAGKIKADIDAMGGPAKVMQQSDQVVSGFVRDVLDESRPPAKVSLAENVVTALLMVEPAQARWGAVRRGACYAFWFALSAGYGTEHAYTSCDH